jgi:hypothetical protein
VHLCVCAKIVAQLHASDEITLTSFLLWPIQTSKICTLTIFNVTSTSTLVQKLARSLEKIVEVTDEQIYNLPQAHL